VPTAKHYEQEQFWLLDSLQATGRSSVDALQAHLPCTRAKHEMTSRRVDIEFIAQTR
jgi:hypothetical protein